MITPTDSFSLTRTSALLRKFIIENWRNLALKTALMYGMLTLGALLIVWGSHSLYSDHYVEMTDSLNSPMEKDYGWEADMLMFTLSLFVFGATAASMTFADMNNKEKRLNALTFPAKQSEKFIVRWAVFIPMFIVLFCGACLLAETVRFLLLKAIVDHPELVSFLDLSHMVTRTVNGQSHLLPEAKITFWSFIAIQSLFCLGSAVWQKASFIKTFIFLGTLAIAYSFIVWLTLNSIAAISHNLEPAYSQSALGIVFRCIAIAVATFCYITAYFRMREMEIINRW